MCGPGCEDVEVEVAHVFEGFEELFPVALCEQYGFPDAVLDPEAVTDEEHFVFAVVPEVEGGSWCVGEAGDDFEVVSDAVVPVEGAGDGHRGLELVPVPGVDEGGNVQSGRPGHALVPVIDQETLGCPSGRDLLLCFVDPGSVVDDDLTLFCVQHEGTKIDTRHERQR